MRISKFLLHNNYQNRLINVQCTNEQWVKKVLIMPHKDSRKSPSEHLEVCISWRRFSMFMYLQHDATEWQQSGHSMDENGNLKTQYTEQRTP